MKVTVFTTKTCAFCKNVKQFLKHKNVVFEEVDVTDDIERRIELQRATSYTTVPITQIGEQYIVGWQPAKLAKALLQ
jgi:glutaredoxin 3